MSAYLSPYCPYRSTMALSWIILSLAILMAQNNLAYSINCTLFGVHEQTLARDSCTEGLVNITEFPQPTNYSLEDVIHSLTRGPGFHIVKGAVSKEDAQLAFKRVQEELNYEKARKKYEAGNVEHNNYSGLIWAILHRGKIFEKLAQHPIVIEVARALLGPNAQLTSLDANTVMPGAEGQKPHLDYPYYNYMFPGQEAMQHSGLLAVQFITLLTPFTAENGATAIRPFSHQNPRYPSDRETFFKHAVQAVGEQGDMLIMAGPIQHCAMPNKSKAPRSALIHQMTPYYVRPFGVMQLTPGIEKEATTELKAILGLSHPFRSNI